MSDSTVNARTVTVGLNGNCDYTSIQEALNENESSASEPLVLLIAPGTYTEKVTVDKPWVSFQPMYSNGGEIIIEESYYSSNTFNAEGEFIPQDEYDVGTDQCGTVLLTANATGFSASGITFQNSYILRIIPGGAADACRGLRIRGGQGLSEKLSVSWPSGHPVSPWGRRQSTGGGLLY